MSDIEQEPDKDPDDQAVIDPPQPTTSQRVRKIGWHGAVSAISLVRRHSMIAGFKVKAIKRESGDSGIVVQHEDTIEEEETLKELKERKHAKLEELLQMEENYLEDLLKISSFISEVKKSKEDPEYPVQMPDELKRMFWVFVGNFHEIRDFHKDVFTERIRSSIWRADLMRDLFRRRECDMKSRYGKYCNNWKKSEYILKKFDSYFKQMEQHLESEMKLEDQMIKPIQMVNRYHLFFGDLVKICERLKEADIQILYGECLYVSKGISHNANDVMATGRIQNFPESDEISRQGNLIRRGSAKYRVRSRASVFGSNFFSKIMKKNHQDILVHMFLFVKSLVVCFYKKNAKEFDLADEYRYWTMFRINKMKIENGEKKEFIVSDTETGQSITLVANTVEDKNGWVKRISREIRSVDKKVMKLMVPTASIGGESIDEVTPPYTG
eukprot:GFUD01010810.1.p1 GENE.GFUD01010810.1~~GFUD01010810.1.p1  ORF type:complete len:440 (+),score=101.66 GFUD01010810.1:96-1415(+)